MDSPHNGSVIEIFDVFHVSVWASHCKGSVVGGDLIHYDAYVT